MAKRAAVNAYKIADHANKPVHKTIMARLKRMSPAQRRQTLVDAKIITKGGKLTKPYAMLRD